MEPRIQPPWFSVLTLAEELGRYMGELCGEVGKELVNSGSDLRSGVILGLVRPKKVSETRIGFTYSI